MVTVFELKTPVNQSTTTSSKGDVRKKIRADVESHISQLTEYCDFISGNANARAKVAKVLGLRGVATVKGVLVFGLQNDLETPKLTKLVSKRQNFNVLPYDSILKKLIEAYARGRSDILPPDPSGEIPKSMAIH